MILLNKSKYSLVIQHLYSMTINNLFARSVIENKVNGSVYADKLDNPETFYIVHPYGMSLLIGNINNKKFNLLFRDYALNINKSRLKNEWMQAFPDKWHTVLNDLFKESIIKSSDNNNKMQSGILELNTRVNFKFNIKKYTIFKNRLNLSDIKIVRTDKKIFKSMKGTVIPFYFWNNVNDFLKHGIGFSIFYNNKLASTAYSAFIHDDKLELGIETIKEFRRKGLAQYTCSALIDYCIEKNFEPVWACSLENIGSYNLALKLGFEEVCRVPYYKLSK